MLVIIPDVSHEPATLDPHLVERKPFPRQLHHRTEALTIMALHKISYLKHVYKCIRKVYNSNLPNKYSCLLPHSAYDHCLAIARAIPGYVLLLISALSSLGPICSGHCLSDSPTRSHEYASCQSRRNSIATAWLSSQPTKTLISRPSSPSSMDPPLPLPPISSLPSRL